MNSSDESRFLIRWQAIKARAESGYARPFPETSFRLLSWTLWR